MNFFFSFFIIASATTILFTDPSLMLGALTTGANRAVSFALYLLPIYAIWLGILELMGESKLTEKLAKILFPITFILFGNQPKETRELLATNIAANLIGVGAAATPSGILAARNMQGESEKIRKSTMMLIVLNASSLQIVPTTIITMRQEAGSVAPADIFLPALITSIFTSILAVGLVKLLVREKVEDEEQKAPVLKFPIFKKIGGSK